MHFDVNLPRLLRGKLVAVKVLVKSSDLPHGHHRLGLLLELNHLLLRTLKSKSNGNGTRSRVASIVNVNPEIPARFSIMYQDSIPGIRT